MKANDELERLFKRWETYPGYEKSFIRDGIIDETRYDQAKLRVLFIAKEPNDPLSDTSNKWDFRSWWSEPRIKGLFSNRVAEWAYGMLHDFPPLESIKKEHRINALKEIAFINLKKSGGGAQADMAQIKEIVSRERELLLKEINIIRPDVIVACIGRQMDILKIVFEGITFHSSGYYVNIALWKAIRLVDFYHPSWRVVPSAMMYGFLGCIVQSEQFKSLAK